MKTLKILTFVIVLGTISGSLLVGINAVTGPLIAKNEELKLKSSVLDVLRIKYNRLTIIKVFDEKVKVLKKDGYVFYTAADGSLAFEFRGPGLWGWIHGIISLEKDLKTIRGMKILHQEETPGLGGRIAEEDYLKQFESKEILPRIIFVPEGKTKNPNEVDAITGATGSSRALEKLLNESIQKYLTILKRIDGVKEKG